MNSPEKEIWHAAYLRSVSYVPDPAAVADKAVHKYQEAVTARDADEEPYERED